MHDGVSLSEFDCFSSSNSWSGCGRQQRSIGRHAPLSRQRDVMTTTCTSADYLSMYWLHVEKDARTFTSTKALLFRQVCPPRWTNNPSEGRPLYTITRISRRCRVKASPVSTIGMSVHNSVMRSLQRAKYLLDKYYRESFISVPSTWRWRIVQTNIRPSNVLGLQLGDGLVVIFPDLIHLFGSLCTMISNF